MSLRGATLLPTLATFNLPPPPWLRFGRLFLFLRAKAVKLACPDRPAVSLTGDGGFGMTVSDWQLPATPPDFAPHFGENRRGRSGSTFLRQTGRYRLVGINPLPSR